MDIEAKQEPGEYDREVFLVLKEFEPTFSRGGDMAMDFLSPPTRVKSLEQVGESAMKASIAKGMPHGYEVGYGSFTINGRMLGYDEPIRVKQGERVLFHILNGSATEIRSVALPAQTFKVVFSMAIRSYSGRCRSFAVLRRKKLGHCGAESSGCLHHAGDLADADDRRHGRAAPLDTLVAADNRNGSPLRRFTGNSTRVSRKPVRLRLHRRDNRDDFSKDTPRRKASTGGLLVERCSLMIHEMMAARRHFT